MTWAREIQDSTTNAPNFGGEPQKESPFSVWREVEKFESF